MSYMTCHWDVHSITPNLFEKCGIVKLMSKIYGKIENVDMSTYQHKHIEITLETKTIDEIKNKIKNFNNKTYEKEFKRYKKPGKKKTIDLDMTSLYLPFLKALPARVGSTHILDAGCG